MALRPWSFSASFTTVALGSTLAFKATGQFSLPIFLVTLITTLFVHAAANLVNTLFDYQRGLDTKPCAERTLVDNILNPEDVKWLLVIVYTSGVVGFISLAFMSPARTEYMALLFVCGVLSSFLYTGGLGLKYIALGDFMIFITFGPVLICFSFLAQTGTISTGILPFVFPLVLNIMAILHSNNTRDIESDKKAKIVTVAILLGGTGSYIYFLVLFFLPYLLFVKAAVYASKWMVLPILTLKEALHIENDFRRRQLINMPRRIAKLNFEIGILYLFAIIVSSKSDLNIVL